MRILVTAASRHEAPTTSPRPPMADPFVTADPAVTLEHKVRQRVRDDESHRRIAEVLTEVAVAAIHPARHLGVGRTSNGMLEDPIASATHAAVETLIAHLEDLVETMPRPIVDRLASEQVAAELGIE